MNKKSPWMLVAILALVVVTFLQALPPPPPNPQDVFEQNPPVPIHVWVQKLVTPLDDGRNMIMRIEFDHDFVRTYSTPDTLVIMYGDSSYAVFNDKHVAPDLTNHDNIYSAYIEENLTAFVAQMDHIQDRLDTVSSILSFEGHVGEEKTTPPDFNSHDFANHVEVEISLDYLTASQCDNNLKKENSLFITDLSVVEDPDRTYNPLNNTGTPMGVWTFGSLLKNVINDTEPKEREFIVGWLQHWMTTQTINTHSVPTRKDIYQQLIKPWILLCDPAINSHSTHGSLKESNWDDIMLDDMDGDDLLKYAPFRLMAIVNRIDLRGNMAFTFHPLNCGETRFIFTLVQPTSGLNLHGIPDHLNSGGSNDFIIDYLNDSKHAIDWMGCNLILEYANIQPNVCSLKNFAQQWVDLSDLTLGSSTYNAALETITTSVTAADAAPTRQNGSALNSLRTNERVFERIPVVSPPAPGWTASKWEFRQFSLNGSGLLDQVPVTNTPRYTANSAPNISIFPSSGEETSIATWIENNEIPVLLERHNFPQTYLSSHILDGAGEFDGEYVHYFGIEWNDPPTNYKKLRRNVSLNTCAGCHGGETKTVFSHVQPVYYGVSNNYWTTSTVPSNRLMFLDNRFAPNENSGGNYDDPGFANRHWVNVSAFLTGRNYSGEESSASYDDDHATDDHDNDLEGLFYVFDPSNDQSNDEFQVWGYNDLQRRKQDLCRFVTTGCSDRLTGSATLDIMNSVLMNPFPLHAH